MSDELMNIVCIRCMVLDCLIVRSPFNIFCVSSIDPFILQIGPSHESYVIIGTNGNGPTHENGVIHCALLFTFCRMKSCHVSVCTQSQCICVHFRVPIVCPLCQSNFAWFHSWAIFLNIYISHHDQWSHANQHYLNKLSNANRKGKK